MKCPTCSSTMCKPVTLVDGSQACTYSEAHRHECEARTVLAMPTLAARRAYLYGTMDQWGKLAGGIDKKRGPGPLKRLEDTMMALHHQRVANAKQRLADRVPGTPLAPANDNAQASK